MASNRQSFKEELLIADHAILGELDFRLETHASAMSQSVLDFVQARRASLRAEVSKLKRELGQDWLLGDEDRDAAGLEPDPAGESLLERLLSVAATAPPDAWEKSEGHRPDDV